MSSRLFVTVFTAVGICCAGTANGADVQALVQACAACHGENGLPADPKTTPVIWGQQASYLYKQLHNYKSGERKSSVMGPVVADISLQDLRQIANYFAAKTWPAKEAGGAGGSLPNGVFAEGLGLPTIWIPHSYPGCSQHAPDEHILLPVTEEALAIMAGLFWDLGEMSRKS